MFIADTVLDWIVAEDWTNCLADKSMLYACWDNIYVVLSPLSISSTMVFIVPLGPIPVLIKIESMFGSGSPGTTPSVAVGSGVINLASL